MLEAAGEFTDEQDNFRHDIIEVLERNRALAAHGKIWLGDLYKEFKDTYPHSYFMKSKTAFTNKCKESFKGLVSERINKETPGGKAVKDRTLDIRTLFEEDKDNDQQYHDDDEPVF